MRNSLLIRIGYVFAAIFLLSVAYNIFNSFFPVNIALAHDDAEHLHVAYLLSIGQRPLNDFFENHALLFPQLLRFIGILLNPHSIREWAFYTRMTIFLHFLLCLIVFYLWSAKILRIGAKGLGFLAFILAWAMTGIYSPNFNYVWQIRPDFICYAYTSLGLYILYNTITKPDKEYSLNTYLKIAAAGVLIGLGNAILPKGIIIILPIIFTGLVVKGPPIKITSLSDFIRYYIKIRVFIIAILFAAISFFIAAAIDCHLAHISLSQWYRAIFLLNTKKHIVFTLRDNNPITALTDAFALPFPLMTALILWLIVELMKGEIRNNILLLFAIFTISINLLIAPYSNGVTFSYYFIPSLFAVAAIYLTILHKCAAICSAKNKGILLPILIVPIIFIQLTKQPIEAIFAHTNRQLNKQEQAYNVADDYLPDMYFPKHFTYLTRNPQDMPVMARHYGYNFMLSHSNNLWVDSFMLGLGPSPDKTWGNGFKKAPPDALAFTNLTDIKEFIFMLKKCQHIDADWLLKEAKNNYILMQKRIAVLFVRKDHLPEMRANGWNIVPTSS